MTALLVTMMSLLLSLLLPLMVRSQFPPNGDQSAMKQMKANVVFNEKQVIRLNNKDVALNDRANHFRIAQEKFDQIQEFVDRGSLSMPGGEEVIEANASAGQQIIDPRTPTGFGDPFFRAVNVEQKVVVDAILSKHEMTMIRAENSGTLKTEISTGWALVHGEGTLKSSDTKKSEFMALFTIAKNKIIRRRCDDCNQEYSDIYYRRKTDDGMHRKLLLMMIGDKYGFHQSDCGRGKTKCEVSNHCYRDFTLHSNYEDAVSGENAWQMCQTVNYGEGVDMYDSTNKIGFPGYSGDTKLVKTEYNEGKKTQKNYAFYVEDSDWIPIYADGSLNMIGGVEKTRLEEAPELLNDSANMIIRRVCLDCTDPRYKDIYYRRKLPVPEDIDIWNIIAFNFRDQVGNMKGRDYDLYSSYEDAINFQNPWEACEDEGLISAEEGDSVRCLLNSDNSGNPDYVYRYTSNQIRLYPNADIASSWDPDWLAYTYIDCTVLPIGADMTMNTAVRARNLEYALDDDHDYYYNEHDLGFYDDEKDDDKHGLSTDRKARALVVDGGGYDSYDYYDYYEAVSAINLALRKPASQSSTCYAGRARLAVDGDTNGRWTGGSVTHTCEEANQYWMVDLEEDSVIQVIRLYNREDCCRERLDKFLLEVLDADSEVVASKYFSTDEGDSIFYPFHDFTFPDAIGRKVRLSKDFGVISLAEVEIYGMLASAQFGIYKIPLFSTLTWDEANELAASLSYSLPDREELRESKIRPERGISVDEWQPVRRDDNIEGDYVNIGTWNGKDHYISHLDYRDTASIPAWGGTKNPANYRSSTYLFVTDYLVNQAPTMQPTFDTWYPVLGQGGEFSSITNIDDDYFRELWTQSPNKILRRLCSDCRSTLHREIYYRRFDQNNELPVNFDLLDTVKENWFSSQYNSFNNNFSLYSSYEDAVRNRNRWQSCNFNDGGVGFPRDCGPFGLVGGQWNSFSRNIRDVAFHVEMRSAGSRSRAGARAQNTENPGYGGVRLWTSTSNTPTNVWDVIDVSFYTTPDCSGTKLAPQGTIIESASHNCCPKSRAFDDSSGKTLWGGRNSGGNFWIGMVFDTIQPIKCVSFLDANGHKANRVTVQVSDIEGTSWTTIVEVDHVGGSRQDVSLDLTSSTEPSSSPSISTSPSDEPTPESWKNLYGFPGRCRPRISDPEDSWEGQLSQSKVGNIRKRHRNGVKHMAFYIEGKPSPETGDWMSEDDEMKAFLFPESTLEADDEIVCKASTLSIDTDTHYPRPFSTDVKPYINRGRDDIYSGWYDIQGCGECSDWCGWFSSDDSFDGGMNPRYQSWTPGNDFFACLSGSSLFESVHGSAIDPTPYNAPFIPADLHDAGNKFASFLKFFPSIPQCSNSYEFSPKLPTYEYVGCFKDAEDRALPHYVGKHMSLEECHASCRVLGFHYFGRQHYSQCYCGGDSSDDLSFAKHSESSANVRIGEVSPNGIERDVKDSEITEMGWTQCYNGNYTEEHSIEAIKGLCQGSRVMYGCRVSGSDTWQLLGYGNRETAFTMTDNDGTIDGIVRWYYTLNSGIGFADSEDELELTSCDFNDHTDTNRLCWHTNNDAITSGWRCGSDIWLNYAPEWERAIWTTSVPTSSITYTPPQCADCESNFIGRWMNCVFRIKYDEDYYPSGTCESFDTVFDIPNVKGSFSSDFIPYKYQIPTVEDPFAGYYDVQRCGYCHDFCTWVGPSRDGSGINPLWKPYTGTDHFTCKLAGGYSAPYGMTERGYFDKSFPYQKCDAEGAPTPSYRREKYLGCFYDQLPFRALPVPIGDKAKLTVEECADSCRDKGYHYFSLQEKGYCYCGGFTAFDHSYAKYGEIDPLSPNYTCNSCGKGADIGKLKQCVYQILDQFDPEVERQKHDCSHIPTVDLRRYCYVSCRDKSRDYKNLLTCKTLSIEGLNYLNREVTSWLDNPICDSKDCVKYLHPLGKEVGQDIGTF